MFERLCARPDAAQSRDAKTALAILFLAARGRADFENLGPALEYHLRRWADEEGPGASGPDGGKELSLEEAARIREKAAGLPPLALPEETAGRAVPVLIAARDEGEGLVDFLISLFAAAAFYHRNAPEGKRASVCAVVCANACRDETAARVRCLEESYRARTGKKLPLALIGEPRPGKSFALRAAVREAGRRGWGGGRALFADADVIWEERTLAALLGALEEGYRLASPYLAPLRTETFWEKMSYLPWVGYGGTGLSAFSLPGGFALAAADRERVFRIYLRQPDTPACEDFLACVLSRPGPYTVLPDAKVFSAMPARAAAFMKSAVRHRRGARLAFRYLVQLRAAEILARKADFLCRAGFWRSAVGVAGALRRARRWAKRRCAGPGPETGAAAWRERFAELYPGRRMGAAEIFCRAVAARALYFTAGWLARLPQPGGAGWVPRKD